MKRICKKCGKECMSRFHQYITKQRFLKIFWIPVDKYWVCDECEKLQPDEVFFNDKKVEEMSFEYWNREFKGSIITSVITMVTFGGFMMEYQRTLDPIASGYGLLFFLGTATMLLYSVYVMSKLKFVRRRLNENIKD